MCGVATFGWSAIPRAAALSCWPRDLGHTCHWAVPFGAALRRQCPRGLVRPVCVPQLHAHVGQGSYRHGCYPKRLVSRTKPVGWGLRASTVACQCQQPCSRRADTGDSSAHAESPDTLRKRTHVSLEQLQWACHAFVRECLALEGWPSLLPPFSGASTPESWRSPSGWHGC